MGFRPRPRRITIKQVVSTLTLGSLMLVSSGALADTYGAGAVIIPMDTTYQDLGMLKAYGLVYELLRNGVPVQWAIRSGKAHGGSDFTASATDYSSGAAVAAHAYRGGPWVIHAEDAAAALPIIATWQSTNTTTVHVATTSFDAEIARYLVVAPNIAMLADGNQKIARKYMQAAGIPDSTLSTAWLDTSPDMLTPDEIAGASSNDHSDGALFDEDGSPVYCQLMSMHWGVSDREDNPEVVAEVRSFLEHPTHFFAECQAVNAFENDEEFGHFLTPNGFLIAAKPSLVEFHNADSPFAQMDGPFSTVGGSEPAYTLPGEDEYKDTDIVMVKAKGSANGVSDLWMTGYLDGLCQIQCGDRRDCPDECLELGKVSYLGGHEYTTKLPMSANPTTQGTRLFLNSLFEAQCATQEGQPEVEVTKSAPYQTTSSQLTYTIEYANWGPTPALRAVLRDALPAGTSFVSASNGGSYSGGVVTWDLGNLSDDEEGTVTVTVTLADHGEYQNAAVLDYHVGLNQFTEESNTTTTFYDEDQDGDGAVDSIDICPDDYNPLQDLNVDVDSCGQCGTVCDVSNATSVCNSGICEIDSCDSTHRDCDGSYATGCEYDVADFADDEANCGACNRSCAPANATGECRSGSCAVASCDSGRENCNGLVADGCEYDTDNFDSDRKHCGDCATACGADELCEAGVCVPSTCPAGFADCGGAAGDCETDILTNPDGCGGCGVTCELPQATASCSAGSCTVAACDPGFSDCNGLPGDGCEYTDASFDSDANNCGGCGIVCAADNGSAICVARVCTIVQCGAGYSDCNGDAADGCEHDNADFASDPANCGGCGIACGAAHATGSCVSGSCGSVSCDEGYVDLDGDAANGCEWPCTATGDPETDCDGVDDDCDGEVDENYVPSSCGLGACTASTICSDGAETCDPGSAGSEGPANSPDCTDGADNDCDGAIDEDDSDCALVGAGGAGAGGAGAGGAASGGAGSGGAVGAGASSGAAANGGGGGTTAVGGTATSGSDAGSTGGSAGTVGDTGSGGSAGSSSGTGGDEPGADSTSGDSGVDGRASDDGGCGCRVAPAPDSRSGMSGLLLLFGLALRRRKTSLADRVRALVS